MADPMVAARVPLEWHKQIREIAKLTGRTEAEVVREALSQYLGVSYPDRAKSLLADIENRLKVIEERLKIRHDAKQ